MRLAGIVMGNASDAIVEKGRRIAAHMLETAEDDITFAAGRFTVKGTDRSISIFDVARAAAEGNRRLYAGRSLPPPMERSGSSAFPTAPTSARSKSIETPARSSLCATPQSTMSAVLLIR
jgi:aerobic carbon-monoxide dehydrogenase large subunit